MGGGTSIEYIRSRLETAGRQDLLDAIGRNEISVYAAGEAAGFFKRPPVSGRGSPNAAKRRAHRIRAVEARAKHDGREKSWRKIFEQLFDPDLTLADCRRIIERAKIPWPLVAKWAAEVLEIEKPPGVAARGL